MKKTISIVMITALLTYVEVANADFTFGRPTKLEPIIKSPPSITADGLEAYFWAYGGTYGSRDLYVSTRITKGDPWTEAVNLGPVVNGSSRDHYPSISPDGLTLYFTSNRSGCPDIWQTTRPTREEPWNPPVTLGPAVTVKAFEFGPCISADGLSLYFASRRTGGYGGDDLWVVTRPTTEDSWENPKNLGPAINSSGGEWFPSISSDGLVLFFGDEMDLLISTRPTSSDPWGQAINPGQWVNSPSMEFGPQISLDGSTIYFASDRDTGNPSNFEVWKAPILPIVDLNGDGIVDSDDMGVMVNHWGENYSLCDIGPTPFGDGIVDVQDLVALSEHLFTYPGAVAHWKLDETEGILARDSVNGYEDVVMGGALWQPIGGKVDGALELDGVDDCLIAAFGLDPAEGPFSIFAWVKDGAPGQTVISEPIGSNWLMVDTEGKLMTELASADSTPLLSETVITDGQWHRIGLVWDGSHRMLCVDGFVAAEDTQTGLEATGGGMYIGVGKDYAAGTFFSGLIDDVRIYNRAVKP